MVIAPEDGGYVGVRAHVRIFPPGYRVGRMPVTVDGRLYRVYLDRIRHRHSRTKATYVFVRLLHPTAAMDFSVERDFPDVLRILTA